jgi:4-amino-4-deoxy-L-arabinose transferase-like glycosyltransferase
MAYALLLILVAAFALRVGVRLWYGEQDFWTNGYSDYYVMAENVAQGKGFCFDGRDCGYWPPVYPFILSLTTPRGKAFPRIVVMQAAFGAGTALCAFLIGTELFGNPTGLLAALLTSLYPYYVKHDTALQEGGAFTFLTAVAVAMLLQARKAPPVWPSLAAGVACGLAILTRASLAPFALAATAVFLVNANGYTPLRGRAARAALYLFGVLAVVTPWLAATYRMNGVAELTAQTGSFLWKAHNAETFSHYPAESIDRSTDQALDRLSAQERDELKRIQNDDAATSRWFARKAMQYVESHPAETVTGAFRKVAAGFSIQHNPRQGWPVDAIYTVSYTPVFILGALGIWWSVARWREILPICLLIGCFVGVTAVFWAHTGHRAYLDVYGIVFASYALRTLWFRLKPAGQADALSSTRIWAGRA